MRQQRWHQSALVFTMACAALGQAQGTGPQFDVISIKATSTGPLAPRCIGGRFTTSSPLDFLLRWVYGLGPPLLVGLPDWVSDREHRYAIEAKVAAPMSEATCKAMVRSMLADRFRMATHGEQREMHAYALTVSKKGSKMREVADAKDIATINGAIFGAADARATAVTMARLSAALSGLPEVVAPVVDRTGLKGTYAFALRYSLGDDGLPTIWTALEEQLGLKLEPIKAPIEVLVVDHIERPTAN